MERRCLLTKAGIVTETGDIITDGAVLQVVREAVRLYELDNADAEFEALFSDGSIYSQMTESEQLLVLGTRNINGDSIGSLSAFARKAQGRALPSSHPNIIAAMDAARARGKAYREQGFLTLKEQAAIAEEYLKSMNTLNDND